MKKKSIIALLLVSCVLAGCDGVTQGSPKDGDIKAAGEVPAETSSDMSAEAEDQEDPASDAGTASGPAAPAYVGEDGNIYIDQYISVRTKFEGWGAVYPVFLFDTPDAANANSEIAALADGVYEDSLSSLQFFFIDNPGSLVTLLVRQGGENDYCCYYPYVFNTETGHRLTNSEIMQNAGVDPSTVHDIASASIMNALNERYTSNAGGITNGNPMFIDGQITGEGWAEGYDAGSVTSMESYNRTFSEETLNPYMKMFLGPDGNLMFTSFVFNMNGGDSYQVYGLNGRFGFYGYAAYDNYYCAGFDLYIQSYDPAQGTSAYFMLEDGQFVPREY